MEVAAKVARSLLWLAAMGTSGCVASSGASDLEGERWPSLSSAADAGHDVAILPGAPAISPLAPFSRLEAGEEEEEDEPELEPRDAATALVDSAEFERCPEGMELVEGAYCPVVRQTCKRWLEDPGLLSYARCAEYEPLTICLSPRVEKRFCIDRHEYTPPGEQLPASHVSWTTARRTCAGLGRRLCTESEWQFACEGEGMMPYPYGTARDSKACNFDRMDLYRPDGSLRDAREPAGAREGCVSPFGVYDLVGNVDEWTVRDESPGPYRSALRGGWWMAGRNRCRAATTAHDEAYEGPQSGFRCCASPG